MLSNHFSKRKGNQEVKTVTSANVFVKIKLIPRREYAFQSQVLLELPPNARRSLLKIAWLSLSSDIA